MNMASPPPSMGHAPGLRPPATATYSVTIAPSSRELRRADAALSFRVSAPGHSHFDVILATDPTLFMASEAHRRTPKNFRSSRQDFEDAPIEVETGFYLVPRAFIRDAISQEPRPGKLYYLSVAYVGEEAMDGSYSHAPDQMGSGPYVLLGAGLSPGSLSHVLGMSVGRMGAVGASGRVNATQHSPETAHMPRMIGGLPVNSRPRRPLNEAEPSPAYRAGPTTPAPAPYQTGTPCLTPAEPAPAMHPAPAPAMHPPEDTPPAGNGAFVDDDYAFSGEATPKSGFRDMDAGCETPQGAFDSYDDGLGPMSMAAENQPDPVQPAPPSEPIPAMDDMPGVAAPSPVATPPASPPAPAVEVTPAPTPAPAPAPTQPQQGPEGDALLQAVLAEGVAGRYEALNLDGAFRGRMGQDHPYYQRAHDGLSIGPHQANQDSGELGELLGLMQATDPAGFNQIFGASAPSMMQAVTAAGPDSLNSPGGRSPRVQPVDGKDLWEDPWVDRFRAASAHSPFQTAMRAHILTRRWGPMQSVAAAFGFADLRGQAMLLTLAIHLGVARATTVARAAVNPFDSPEKVQVALQALGTETLQAFQSARGLTTTDTLDDATHFALLSALRAKGPVEGLTIPDAETAMDSLVTAVGPGPAGDALLKLRVSATFRPRG